MSTKLRQRRVESDDTTEKHLDVDYDDSKKVYKKKEPFFFPLILSAFLFYSMERTQHLVNVALKLIKLRYSLFVLLQRLSLFIRFGIPTKSSLMRFTLESLLVIT